MEPNGVQSAPQKHAGGRPLRYTLAGWFSVIAVLSCVCVGSLTYYLRAQGMRQQTFERLDFVRDDKIRVIGAWFAERRNDMDVWRRATTLVSLCQQRRDGAELATGDRVPELETLRSAYNYDVVFLADPTTGRPFLTTNQDPGRTDRLAEEDLSRVRKSRRSVISDVFLDEFDRHPKLIVAGPVVSPATSEILGILVFEVAMETSFYPLFTQSERLGKTGEALLVNRDRLAQSPLKYQAGAVGELIIEADPARRAAVGHPGQAAVDDYRSVPVMASYGHVAEADWGLVVKQDMSEIDAPVRRMARHVAMASLAVLAAAVALSFLVAGRIAQPAMNIAAVAQRIGAGDTESRAAYVGPVEIQRIAESLNRMVETLSRRVRVNGTLNDIYVAASSQNRVGDLLGEVLPRIMAATRSQAGVVYLSDEVGQMFHCMPAVGMPQERVAQQFRLSPPDHLLAEAATAGSVQVFAEIPEGNDLRIVTQAGQSRPRALMAIPLMRSERAIAVIGLASLYDYRPEDRDLAETLCLSLGQSLVACLANETTEKQAEELQYGNEELSGANEELQLQSEELREQAEELQAQQAALEEADRLKSEFLSNMSHELRTPLNSVMALSQLMISRGPGVKPEQDVQYLQIIDRNGRHLLSLINDILDLAKIESGRMERFFSEFRAHDVLDRALEIARPLAEAKDLPIVVQVDDVPTIRSDEEKVRQILLNLLSNAVKFTDSGRIEVAIAASDSHVSFAVRDSGLGIADSQQEYVFDEFRQVDGSTTRAHDGTGLGLSIGRKLARLLGGEITVESTLGTGSTFTLTLPLQPDDSLQPDRSLQPDGGASTVDLHARKRSRTPARKSKPSSAAAARKRTVLVIDDNPADSDLLEGLLEEAGYHAVVAHDGTEGLQLARQICPFVILLDVLMPNTDGWEVLRELKNFERTANIPAIVVSVSEDRATGVALGAAAYLEKPIDKRSVLAEIERIATSQEGTSQAATSQAAGHVLVVDDNDVAALQIRSALEGNGYRVTVATGGAEALLCVERTIPDAIVLDLMMPEVDGFEVLERIGSIDWLAHVPVLVLTAKELTTHDLSRLKSDNIRELIQKGSVNREQLVACVAKLFEKASSVVSVPPGSPETVEEASAPSPTAAGKKTVLVVEDNPDNRFTLAQLLENMGYDHIPAENGWQAIAAAKEHLPDLILMDLQLPGLGGLDAAKQIQADPATAKIPIVAVTAKAMRGDREAVLAEGCDGYLSKPIDQESLRELLLSFEADRPRSPS